MKKKWLIFWILILFFPSGTSAKENEQTFFSDLVLTQNQDWEGIKIINGAKITIETGVTLNIKPGSMIIGLNGGSIYVKGKMKALGEENRKIRFTSDKDRNQIFNLTYSINSVLGSEIELKNFILEDGGGNRDVSFLPALTVRGKVSLIDGVIRRNRFSGVRFWNNSGNQIVENCEIYENENLSLENKSPGFVLAKNNWWGSEKGPSLIKNDPQAFISGNFDFSPWQEKGHIPIVIIPGFGGSFGFSLLSEKAGDNWWFNPIGTSGYRFFIKALLASGYASGRDFFLFSYDFRKDIGDIGQNKLKDFIKKVKEKSGHSQISLVSHSMGGLVARSYVESENFNDDVDRIVTAGTPHLGSSEVYPIWSGGEFLGMKKILLPYFWYLENWKKNEPGAQMIRSEFVSLGQMMPIYDFLFNKEKGQPLDYKDQKEKNLFLEELNSEDLLNNLKRKTLVTLIAGTGQETLEKIEIKNYAGEESIWVDGVPDPLNPPKDTTKGDGTVPQKSALGDGKISKEAILIEANHGDLFNKAQRSIFSGLNIKPYSPTLFKIMSQFWLTAYSDKDLEIEVSDESGILVKKDFSQNEDSEYHEEIIDEQKLAFLNIPFESLAKEEVKKMKITFISASGGKLKAGLFFNSQDRNFFQKDLEADFSENGRVEYEISIVENQEILVSKKEPDIFIGIKNIEEGKEYLNWQYLSPEIILSKDFPEEKIEEVKTECFLDESIECFNFDLTALSLGQHKIKGKGSWQRKGQKESSQKELNFFVSTSFKSFSKIIARFYEEKRMNDWSKRNKLIDLSSIAHQNLSEGEVSKAKSRIEEMKNLVEKIEFKEKKDKESLKNSLIFLEGKTR